jgi:pimeloyl-[acyl-carrier protein] methyl ester esterase
MPADLTLSVRGARLRYRVSGRGPALVLVHGWTLDLEMWEPQIEALVDAFRVVRFDRRGFGLSSGRPGLAQDVADLDALYRRLRIRRAALLGMSQGARVIARFALLMPDRVSCLVFDGPPRGLAGADRPEGGDIPLSEYRALVRERGVAAFRAEWSRHALMRLRTADPRPHALLARMIERYPANDLREAAPSADHGRQAPQLDRLRKPALVITGALDLASRQAAADALARRLPLGERASVPDAGHLPNLDNPHAYNAVLRDFLVRHVRMTR